MFRHTLVNQFLEYSAERFPGKTALVHLDKRLTYRELDLMANRLANTLLSVGVERGDRVVVFMDNSIEAVISIFAILKAGAAFVVINHTTKSEKLNYILNNNRANVILTQDSRADVLRNVNSSYLKTIIMSGSNNGLLSSLSFKDIISSGNDKALKTKCIDLDLVSIIYTSGSTGQPKGIMLNHLNMVSAAHSITTYLENNENDVIMNMLPLSFDYGLYQILMGFKIGGTIILEKSFTYPYQIIQTIIKEKVTGLPGVPTIFTLLLQMKDIFTYDFRSIRYITNTAAALPVSHIKRLRELFPMAKLYSMYGLTECKRVSYLPPDELDRKPTSVGKAMPNEEVYIINEKGDQAAPGEVGELVVRGSNVMLGYWEMPEETAKCLRPGRYPGENVLYTGDLFRMDEEGFLYFIARKDDIIKCRGEKISPREIENTLYNLNGVIEAAVIGITDEIMGEAIKAFVVLEEDSKLTERDIMMYCSQHLENSALPQYIEITSSFEKTTTGKIDKQILKVCTVFNPEIRFKQMLHSYLSETALRTPDKIAVVQGNRRITYGEMDKRIFQLSSFLLGKIKPGDRVGILSENSPEYIIAYFGIQKAGGISVDINPQYSVHEIRKILNSCSAEMVFAENKLFKVVSDVLVETPFLKTVVLLNFQDKQESQLLNLMERISSHIKCTSLTEILNNITHSAVFPEIAGEDIASIVYTSGTTGEPKGIMLSHDNFISNAKSIMQYLHLTGNDKVMVVLPFCYSYGKSLLTTHIIAGGTLVLENSFMYPNVVLDKMVEEDVTGFAGVPSTFAILLNRSNIHNYRFPKLRYVTQAGGPMSPKHARELSYVLPDTHIYIMYGQTEATARLTYLEPHDLLRKPGSIGKSIPGVKIKLIKDNGTPAEKDEEGEIVVGGENVMAGYWNNPEESEKVLRGNKLFTGDIAKMDEDGYFYIVGRRSDMIKSGAHRISPKEIEEVILEMQEVHEVCVVSIEDVILGEAIRAVVVLKPGYVVDAKKIQRHCHTKLASFKIPKEVVFVDDLPKTNSGKVRGHLLKDQKHCKTRVSH
jgi:long-chain acyl-CoA synthetase